MENWQEVYIQNIEKINALSFVPEAKTVQELQEKVTGQQAQARLLVEENSALIRDRLFPALESISRASQQELDTLSEFAQALTKGSRPDNSIALHIHESLLTVARSRHDREMLLRELYECGMCTFYQLSASIGYGIPEKWRRQMRLYFREAASYLRIYDQIPSTEARGYIHRSMGNLALTYGRDDALKKLRAVNDSLRVLTDPRYHEKTPDLPWDRFIYSTHQERTTLLYTLRTGTTTPEIVAQVMDSAQYVYSLQMQRAQKQGKPLEPRWRNVYDSALFFSGITDVQSYLNTFVDCYKEADENDFSADGLFANVDTGAYLMDTIYDYAGDAAERYYPIADEMLRHGLRYISRLPRNVQLHRTTNRLLMGFNEFPGSMTRTELFCRLAPLTARDLFLHSVACGEFARYLVQLAARENPALLESLNGLDAEDMAYRAGLLHDIGLLQFPRSYLCPSRQLLQSEWELMERHCDFGAHLLARSPSTQALASAVGGHHWPEYAREFYHREEDKTPILTDIVHLADVLSECVAPESVNISNSQPVDECIHTLEADVNNTFRPELVQLVLNHREELKSKQMEIMKIAYQKLFDSMDFQ